MVWQNESSLKSPPEVGLLELSTKHHHVFTWGLNDLAMEL